MSKSLNCVAAALLASSWLSCLASASVCGGGIITSQLTTTTLSSSTTFGPASVLQSLHYDDCYNRRLPTPIVYGYEYYEQGSFCAPAFHFNFSAVDTDSSNSTIEEVVLDMWTKQTSVQVCDASGILTTTKSNGQGFPRGQGVGALSTTDSFRVQLEFDMTQAADHLALVNGSCPAYAYDDDDCSLLDIQLEGATVAWKPGKATVMNGGQGLTSDVKSDSTSGTLNPSLVYLNVTTVDSITIKVSLTSYTAYGSNGVQVMIYKVASNGTAVGEITSSRVTSTGTTVKGSVSRSNRQEPFEFAMIAVEIFDDDYDALIGADDDDLDGNFDWEVSWDASIHGHGGSNDDDPVLSTGAIVGIALGAAAVVVIAFVLFRQWKSTNGGGGGGPHVNESECEMEEA